MMRWFFIFLFYSIETDRYQYHAPRDPLRFAIFRCSYQSISSAITLTGYAPRCAGATALFFCRRFAIFATCSILIYNFLCDLPMPIKRFPPPPHSVIGRRPSTEPREFKFKRPLVCFNCQLAQPLSLSLLHIFQNLIEIKKTKKKRQIHTQQNQ